MLRYFVITLIVFITAVNSWSQSFFIEKTPLSNIITNSSVEDIFQDNEGFVWFATHTGLVQYSGSYSRVFSPKSREGQNTKSEFFYKVTEDTEKNLWIGSRDGLVFIDSTRNRVVTYGQSEDFPLPNNRIFDVFFYNDSLLFLACDRSGLTYLNINSFELVKPEPILEGSDLALERIWVREHWKGSDENLYIRTSEGYFIYFHGQNKLSRLKESSIANINSEFYPKIFGQDLSGDFWFIDHDFILYRWAPGQRLDSFDLENLEQIIHSGVFGIFPFDSIQVIIASNKGNYLFNPESGNFGPLRLRGNSYFEPIDARIVSIGHMREGPIFVSFRAGVTGMINPEYQDFQFVEIQKRWPDELMNTVFVLDDEENGTRYISTFLYPSIIVEDLETGEFREIPKEYPGNLSSNRMLIDSSGRLWICQNRGIMEVNRETLETTFYKAPGDAVLLFDMVEANWGEFYVGSFREGLFRFVPDLGVFEKVEEDKGWVKTQVFCLTYDPLRKSLWIGTVRNGLFQYDVQSDTFYHYMPDRTNPNSIGGDWIRSIAVGPDDKIWFAVDPAGLGSFNYLAHVDSAFQSFGLNEGMPSNFIAGIVFDHHQKLWMSSLAGLASFDPGTYEVSTYQPDNGTRNQTFYYNNMSVNSNNEIFVGSTDGYVKFKPGILKANHVPPKISLIEFEILGRNQNIKINPFSNQEIYLKHNENNIRIEFAAINFTRPEKNEIFYQLQNHPDNWQKVTGSSQIYFSQLAPGSYNFRLRAKSGDGVWSSNEVQLPIFIAKPFYNSWWFYTILGIVVFFGFYFGYRYQLNNKLKENRLKTEKKNIKSKMEKQLANLKLLSLRSQMNPHFIFNCLNSINRFILINDNDTASEYLTKFSRLIRKVLDNSREDKITLEKDIETLKLYIEMEKMRFIKKFDYSINVDEGLELNKLKIQPMLIQPFVENAIWHGLMHKNTKGLLEIFIGSRGGELYIQIKDDGIGREQSKKIRSGLQFKHKSYGMRVTQERMEMEKYHSSFVSSSRVTDLYCSEGRPIGTLVEICLPMESNEVIFSNQ